MSVQVSGLETREHSILLSVPKLKIVVGSTVAHEDIPTVTYRKLLYVYCMCYKKDFEISLSRS